MFQPETLSCVCVHACVFVCVCACVCVCVCARVFVTLVNTLSLQYDTQKNLYSTIEEAESDFHPKGGKQ
jgi:hypothetical protein